MKIQPVLDFDNIWFWDNNSNIYSHVKAETAFKVSPKRHVNPGHDHDLMI